VVPRAILQVPMYGILSQRQDGWRCINSMPGRYQLAAPATGRYWIAGINIWAYGKATKPIAQVTGCAGGMKQGNAAVGNGTPATGAARERMAMKLRSWALTGGNLIPTSLLRQFSKAFDNELTEPGLCHSLLTCAARSSLCRLFLCLSSLNFFP